LFFIVSISQYGLSALGKLGTLVLLLAAFGVGMAGVVYMSLSGAELKVPEIVGKDFVESEKELAALGLKIKKRADRPSTEKINTVLEQLPKAGETVKTGQMILVVVSKAGLEGEETPSTLKQELEEDDSERIEEMISDKPRKSRSNSNTNKKKADTTRDVIANTASNTSPAGDAKPGDKETKEPGTPDKPAKTPGPTGKPQQTPAQGKPAFKPGTVN
jgi:beta-lactam-binding protein with PASTA domain